jgi:hypothetical protein
MSRTPAELSQDMLDQAGWCERLGSPFYKALCVQIASNVEAGGVCWKLLEERAREPRRMKLPLRFLSSVHRFVLEGKLPALARHFPSTGGSGDPEAAWQAMAAALSQRGERIIAALPDTVQTSEVKRCCALLPGFLEVARSTRLPLRLIEIGSCAGLNLRWDCYRYVAGRGAWGPEDAPLVFEQAFAGDPPDLGAAVRVAERRGCDLHPVDPTTDEGRLTLQSFLWPDQPDRFERLARAIEVARRVPAIVDRADAVDWVEAQLTQGRPGLATVVFHSIVLPYLSEEARARLVDVLHTAGARATPEAPLAWLSMEPDTNQDAIELTEWPGGMRRRVATAGFHAGKVSAWGRMASPARRV